MRSLLPSQHVTTYSKLGLMVLKEHFSQRTIGTRSSSFRGRVHLSTPSGPQWVESALEAELLEQLSFSFWVYDLITQPIIHFAVGDKRRQYAPDIAVQLDCAFRADRPSRYIIEVKRRADLRANGAKYALKFQAARTAAAHMGGSFCVMDEARIRTPYLQNTRLLRRYIEQDPTSDVLDILREKLPDQQLSIGQALSFLAREGVAEPDARAGLEEAVAWRFLNCDLSVPFDDNSLVHVRAPGAFPTTEDDPILHSLHEASLELV